MGQVGRGERNGGRETGRDKDTGRQGEARRDRDPAHTHHPDRGARERREERRGLPGDPFPCLTEGPSLSPPKLQLGGLGWAQPEQCGHPHQRPQSTHKLPVRGGALTDRRRRWGSSRWREGAASPELAGSGWGNGGALESGLGIQGCGSYRPRCTPNPAYCTLCPTLPLLLHCLAWGADTRGYWLATHSPCLVFEIRLASPSPPGLESPIHPMLPGHAAASGGQ